MPKGYFSLILNAHLPFVRHPDQVRILEENWLFDGLSETYLPLLRVFERLEKDGIPFRIVLSLSPTLNAMLSDSLLNDRYVRHLERMIELAKKEIERNRYNPEFLSLAGMYLNLFETNYNDFVGKYERNVIDAFKRLADLGRLDLITSSATHSFLPLMDEYPKGVKAQVRISVESHARLFGKKPEGMWLPECGYYPGLEKFLKANGIHFFFLDTHGITYAEERPKYGVYAPLACRNGVFAFGRDPESSLSVWSFEEGYPGDVSYREFYRDIGFDLPIDYLRPYILENDVRINTGLKYYAITGPGDEKKPYNRCEALKKVEEHSDNFIYRRKFQIDRLSALMDRPPLIIAPFDIELFGHWWFEGADWMEAVIRKLSKEKDEIALITPTEYLDDYPNNQVATPSFSSWGNKGYAEVWLDGSNDWIYRHVHKATERMTQLAQMFPSINGVRMRALNQAARELLLMQASDWAFIMKAGTTVPYAVKRVKEHVHNFNKIYESLLTNKLSLSWLSKVEEKNNIFPEIDYSIYA